MDLAPRKARQALRANFLVGMRHELVSKKTSWQCHFWNTSRTGLEKDFMAVPFLECEKEFMAVPFLECVTNWSRKRIHGSAIVEMRHELVSKKNSWQCLFWNAKNNVMAVQFLECVPNWSRKRIHGSAIVEMRHELVSKKNSWQCLFWNAKKNSWQCHFWNASRTGLEKKKKKKKKNMAVPLLKCVTNWSRKRIHGSAFFGMRKRIHGSAIVGMRHELVSKKNSWQCHC